MIDLTTYNIMLYLLYSKDYQGADDASYSTSDIYDCPGGRNVYSRQDSIIGGFYDCYKNYS